MPLSQAPLLSPPPNSMSPRPSLPSSPSPMSPGGGSPMMGPRPRLATNAVQRLVRGGVVAYTQTRTHTLFLSLFVFFTPSLLSLPHKQTVFVVLFLEYSLFRFSITHTHTLTLPHCHNRTQSYAHTHTHDVPHAHTHTLGSTPIFYCIHSVSSHLTRLPPCSWLSHSPHFGTIAFTRTVT